MRLRNIFCVLSLLAILSALAGGTSYYLSLKEVRAGEIAHQHTTHAEAAKDRFLLFISEYLKITKAMSELPVFREVLENPDTERLEQADKILDLFCESMEAGVCYLMDTHGTVIAATNRDQPDSFVGQNYAFRPYFQQAIQGINQIYMGTGWTSGKRGVYYSHPVFDTGQSRLVGVIVTKVPMEHLERAVGSTESGDWAVTDKNGMVFASDRPEWRNCALWSLSPEQTRQTMGSRQFGTGPWQYIGFKINDDGTAVDRDGTSCLVRYLPLEHYPAWLFFYITPGNYGLDAWKDPLIRRGAYSALFICLIIGLSVLILYKRANADIVRRRQAEAELEESRKFYQTIFENTGTGTILSHNNSVFMTVNAEFEKLTGYSRNEIEGRMRWTDFVIPDDHEILVDYCMRIRGGDMSAPDHLECRIKDRQGRIRDVLVRAGQDTGTGMTVASFLDITSHKEADRALQRSEERYHRFFEADFSGAYISRPDGKLVDCNPAFARIFGAASADELRKVNLESFYCSYEDRKQFLAHLREVKKVEYYEAEIYCVNGVPIQTIENAVGVFDENGELSEIWGYVMDVTEQKRMKEQLHQAQKMEAVGTLAGGIAHDFNNLLMAITGNISLMLHDTDCAHPHYSKLKNIEKCVESAARLTSQLMGYARKGQYEVRPLQLNPLAVEAGESVARTRQDIRVYTEFESHLLTIDADRNQMEQVMLNICTNACEAMPDGGELFIRTSNIPHSVMRDRVYNPEPGCYVMLEITDTGGGMDNQTITRIFDPFFTTRSVSRGTGLGLASVYGIVKSHNGYIHVESEKGEGASFILYFPASSSNRIGADAVPECKPAAEITPGSGTILLVDDEEMVREVATQMLDTLGYTVLQAENGETALRIYREKQDKIRMVILDMVMSGMGGGETFERLKAIDPDVRAVLSSGYSLDSQARAILEMGCCGFIQKPFNMQTLSSKIGAVMKNIRPDGGLLSRPGDTDAARSDLTAN